MHTTTLRKVGGSVMLAVPPAILDVLQFRAGATVGLSVEDGCLVVTAQPRPRHTLDELLAQCQGSEEVADEDRTWLEGTPAGRELL
jgi:antitoxin ChpS